MGRYRAAARKVLRSEWSLGDILLRLSWLASELRLDLLDALVRRRVLGLPYREGLAFLTRWAERSWVANAAYRAERRAFLQLVGELGGIPGDANLAFRDSLRSNLFSRIALKPFSDEAGHDLLRLLEREESPFWASFSRMLKEVAEDGLDALFPVDGLEHLQEAHKAGRGVILLTYHSPVNRLAVGALALRFPGELIPTISEKRARRESRHWQDNQARDLPARELEALKAGMALEGRHLLGQDRIVQLVGDNEFTSQGQAVVLAGRRYHLRPGFAELALGSGAAVVPQYNHMDADGRIRMTILPPFEVGGGSRQAQVAGLLEKYANFIEASWRAAPESVRWPRMRRHFNQPRVG